MGGGVLKGLGLFKIEISAKQDNYYYEMDSHFIYYHCFAIFFLTIAQADFSCFSPIAEAIARKENIKHNKNQNECHKTSFFPILNTDGENQIIKRFPYS